MLQVKRVLCLEDGLEICIAGRERRWQIASYSLRLVSREYENSCLKPPSRALTRKRFDTDEALVAALRREIELHGKPAPTRALGEQAPIASATRSGRQKARCVRETASDLAAVTPTRFGAT